MTMIRRGVLALTVLGAQSLALALTPADFGKIYEGTGTAVDLNNTNQVLLRDAASFTIVDTASGARSTVGLSAELTQAGYTTLSANDLSNTGYVTGFVGNASGNVPFLWSAASGFRLVPAGFGGLFVNDSGVTVGPSGTWSPATGATTALNIPGTVRAFNNAGQIAYVTGFYGYPGNPGGYALAGVMGPAGETVQSWRYDVSAPTGVPTTDDQFQIPDNLVVNDAGLAVVGFAGVKSYSSFSLAYAGTGSTGSRVAGMAASVNNKGQIVAQESGSALSAPYCGCYTDTVTGETADLSKVWGISPLIRINDSGVILQDKGASFAMYKAGAGTPPPVDPPPPVVPVGTGTGLKGQYFNTGLFGNTLITTRIENPNFDWGTARPAPGVRSDFFTVKWTGSVQAEEAGTYKFRTLSDEGVRVTVNGQKVIDHWKAHTAATDVSPEIVLEAGKRYDITIEYYDLLGKAVMRLSWLKPGATDFTAVPTERLYQP
jgi:hypothetical protein